MYYEGNKTPTDFYYGKNCTSNVFETESITIAVQVTCETRLSTKAERKKNAYQLLHRDDTVLELQMFPYYGHSKNVRASQLIKQNLKRTKERSVSQKFKRYLNLETQLCQMKFCLKQDKVA